MTTVAVSKNKRSQVLFRTTPPITDRIIIAYDHEESVDDTIFLAQVVDEVLEFDVGDFIETEVSGEISVVYDDTALDVEVCG